MDLLRFEDKDVGPVYVDGRFLFILAADPMDGEATKIGVHGSDGSMTAALGIAGDVEEVAMAIEKSVPGARIHRIG